jgi:hypothetical protein
MIADIGLRFRAACHWALFAETIAGPNGLPSTDIPHGAPNAVKAEAMQRNAALIPVRKMLYPEDPADG